MGSTGTAKVDQMNVPYDQWGTFLDGADIQDIRDAEGNMVGDIRDREVFVKEHQLTPIEKRDAVNFALEFYSKLDGGWMVDDDYKIYFAYEDGTFRDVADNPEKGLNRKGLIGVSVSTPDDEMVWGGNVRWRNGRKEFQQWGVHDEDGNEVEGNYHAWFKTVASYRQRVKTTYNNPNGRGGYRTKREVIRQSQQRPWR